MLELASYYLNYTFLNLQKHLADEQSYNQMTPVHECLMTSLVRSDSADSYYPVKIVMQLAPSALFVHWTFISLSTDQLDRQM